MSDDRLMILKGMLDSFESGPREWLEWLVEEVEYQRGEVDRITRVSKLPWAELEYQRQNEHLESLLDQIPCVACGETECIGNGCCMASRCETCRVLSE